MENENYLFFAAFNRLDKLCSDMYGEPHGVTQYIEHMKEVNLRERSNIGTWDADLRQLIRLRSYRNKLAHGTSFEEPLSNWEDTQWIEDFYDRILHQEDPLARISQKQEQPWEKRDEKKRDENAPVQTGSDLTIGVFAAFVIVLVAVALWAYLK